MTTECSADICRKLQAKFYTYGLYRPIRVSRYEAGTELAYEVKGIEKPDTARVHLQVERFIGGGFAGQVYRVKVLDIQNSAGRIDELKSSGVYAMKILVPPSGFSCLFRNFLYAIGFQGPFQLQVNPAAARVGALWQKFIRQAAKIRFGDEKTVVDIHATFVDEKIGSCGELSEWVEGRTWRLEADDHMDLLKFWRRGKIIDPEHLGSPEYRAKKEFMADFVKMLHDLGAYEFARQYEWSTCKSQPNCLKRWDTENRPDEGLVAVDFRPGLVLLPFLPMSPGDFKLIVKGIIRGSIVQFDRGDISKLETFVHANKEQFSDMRGMLEELKADEKIYRDSVPDVSQNDIRLFYDRRLWSTILDSAVTGWKVRNLVDDGSEKKIRSSRLLTVVFLMLGLIPFLGKFVRRLWGRLDWRRHYASMLTNGSYFVRAINGKIMEKTIVWFRSGRISSAQAVGIYQQPWRFFYHLPFLLLLLPSLHRFLVDADFRKEKLVFIFIRPFKLYFSSAFREQWLRDMVAEGQKKHILTDDDANTIISQIKEPYIQKYLVSLVVHLLLAPTTHIVAFVVAAIYYLKTGDKLGSGGIIVLFQVIPISPGSIARGLYTVSLAIHDRSFKDYNIALLLSFFKYIGYLAFPIQMTYRYPALSRFMAGHWATEMVHVVPVFGERGALLEHWIFCLFYNWPLTIRRRIDRRAQVRATLSPRYWHAGVCVFLAVLALAFVNFTHLNKFAKLPEFADVWWLVFLLPLVLGTVITLGCGGAQLWRRVVTAAVSGAFTGILSTVVSAIISRGSEVTTSDLLITCAMYTFIFTVLSTIGAIVTELILPDPDLRRPNA